MTDHSDTWVDERRRHLHQAGLTDRQIADGMQSTAGTIKAWRRKNEYPANGTAQKAPGDAS